MYAHAVTALLAISAVARAQQTASWVETDTTSDELEEVEKRYTPELELELQSAKDEALLLYTEYTSRAGQELKLFLREMTGFGNRSADALDEAILSNAPQHCRDELEKKLFKVEKDAKLAASFSGVNHHKFMLGPIVVMRMHLNKSEELINKCEKVVAACGISCETTPRVRRWRRHAADELHRVKDDIQHTRMSYKDILLHAHRHLKQLRKHAHRKAEEITKNFLVCGR